MSPDSQLNVLYHHPAGSWLNAKLHGLREQANLHVRIINPDHLDEFADALAVTDVIWHTLEPLTADHIAMSSSLQLIQKIGTGTNTIDLRAAAERGIAVCNMPGTNSRAVSEMTLCLILATLRRLTWYHSETVAGNGWNVSPDIPESCGELAGRVVGLVGYGSVPRLLAPVLLAMGARLLYTATSAKHDAVGEWCDLDRLLAEADIVSIHVPLTESTTALIDRDRIRRMKPGAILINTARGGVVDNAALVAALKSGRLSAAGLDVFGSEPLDVNDPILHLQNVVVSPHVAWHTGETLERSLHVAVENCNRLRTGRALLHRVV